MTKTHTEKLPTWNEQNNWILFDNRKKILVEFVLYDGNKSLDDDNIEDINNGFKLMLTNDEIKNRRKYNCTACLFAAQFLSI